MCLRISGIRETQNEDVTKKVLDFAKTVNSNIKSADIDRAHRVGRPRSHIDNDETDAFDDVADESNAKGREIIIKFTNSSARLNLLQGRSVLRDKKVKNVFINEDLTPARKQLAFECRRIRRIKKSKIEKTWTYGGYPHILDTFGNKVKITCLSDLMVYDPDDVMAGAQPMNT